MIQFGLFSLADVDAGTDVAEEVTVRFEARCARIEQPPVFTVRPAQTILDGEWLPFAKAVPQTSTVCARSSG